MRSLTEGKPTKLILQFAIPLMIGNAFQQMYTMADAMVVGKVLGVAALAAMGSVDWPNWMMLATIQGFTQGFAIPVAKAFGANNPKELRKTVVQSIYLSILLCIILMVVGEAGIPWILRLLKTPTEIAPLTVSYLRIAYCGVPVILIYNFLSSLLRSLGDAKTPFYAMIVASISNIILDILFVWKYSFGIQGAAIATVIAQGIACGYCYYFVRRIPLLSLKESSKTMDFHAIKYLLGLGTPMALQNMTIAIGGIVVQAIVNSYALPFIAGYTATSRLYGLLEIAATSYGYAMVAYAGQNLGAKRIDRIRIGVKESVQIATLTSILISGCMILFGKTILLSFLSGTPEEISQALSVAYHFLFIMSVFLPILYLLHVIRSTLQGCGNTILPMCSGIAELVVRCLAALLLPIYFGESGILYAEISAWIGADVVLFISYFFVLGQLEKKNSEN